MRTGLVAAGGIALGSGSWEEALAASARRGRSPYGPLGPPDSNGVRLPERFRSRVIARGGVPVAGTGYVWPIFPDGAATFRTRDDGWILVSNSEVPTAVDVPGPIVGNPGEGGASAIRFDARGNIADAYRILSGTSTNCAGGATPWGTWLSCEEHEEGLVWECDPRGKRDGAARPALGTFQHEAVCVDRRRGHLYLTEDLSDGGFYRFTPRRKGDLRKGRLEIAKVRRGKVEWVRVPDPAARETPTRLQVEGATKFKRGEGIWFDRGIVYIATTGDSRILAYNVRRKRMRVLYDPERLHNPPLHDVDNIAVSPGGELFVCEDNGGDDPFDVCLITLEPRRRVSRFAKLTGPQHGRADTDASSEIAGVAFNPRGDRMYFSSQRAFVTGVTYEVRGPFKRRR
jgi:uncharacterized protein